MAWHGGVLRTAIHAFKYKGRKELAEPLGRMLFSYWQQHWQITNLATDLVVPVPLHASRQRERGYNQSALLARVLARQARLALDDIHLVRTRATPPQVGLNAHERQANVQDAFTWTGTRLGGVAVLLIDDVCTTGATLQACALTLRGRGAKAVWALTLARPLEEWA